MSHIEFSNGSSAIRVASFFLLIISVVLFLIVGQRVAAAAWQWYMFYGYPTPGVVSLSLRTGVLFSFVSVIFAALSVFNYILGKRFQEGVGCFISKCASLVFLLGLIVYWSLAMSPLNQWAP